MTKNELEQKVLDTIQKMVDYNRQEIKDSHNEWNKTDLTFIFKNYNDQGFTPPVLDAKAAELKENGMSESLINELIENLYEYYTTL